MPSTLACASEPGIRPQNSFAKLTSLRAIPPLFIILPARINSGTARSEKLSIPLFIFCIVINVICSQDSEESAATIDETTMLTEIGQPKNSKIPKIANKITVIKPILIFYLTSSIDFPVKSS